MPRKRAAKQAERKTKQKQKVNKGKAKSKPKQRLQHVLLHATHKLSVKRKGKQFKVTNKVRKGAQKELRKLLNK